MDTTAILAAVDFATIVTGIGGVAAAVAVALVAKKGAGMLLSAISR